MLQIMRELMFRGNMKYPCVFCLFDSYDKNKYEKHTWPRRESFFMNVNCVINEPLIEAVKIILPTLHIKLGLFKQFVKTCDVDSVAFSKIVDAFPR